MACVGAFSVHSFSKIHSEDLNCFVEILSTELGIHGVCKLFQVVYVLFAFYKIALKPTYKSVLYGLRE